MGGSRRRDRGEPRLLQPSAGPVSLPPGKPPSVVRDPRCFIVLGFFFKELIRICCFAYPAIEEKYVEKLILRLGIAVFGGAQRQDEEQRP